MKKYIKCIFISVLFILFFINSLEVRAVDDEIKIKITPNNTNWTTSDVMLIIDIDNSKIFDASEKQAVQIIIGKESDTNTWIDLGTGTNGMALKKTYNYIINENGEVSVRIISWKTEDKSDLKQLCIQKINVSNIDKNQPIIENVNIISTISEVNLEVVAKDLESGIEKYSCKCIENGKELTNKNGKFVFNEFEENREYNFEIEVEDKIGNKITKQEKIITKTNISDENVIAQIEQNNFDDNTIAHDKIPEVGSDYIIWYFGIFVLTIIIIILKK